MGKTAAKKPTWPHGKITKMSAHRNGQWCKKIRGRLHYFGPWSDHKGALGRYLANADALHEGLPVETSPSGVVTIADVMNKYLESREADVRGSRRELVEVVEGSISAEMFTRYRRAGTIMAKVLGRDRAADSLDPSDWAKVRNHMKAKYTPYTMSNYINCLRAMFSWAYEDGGLTSNAPRFGSNFRVKGLAKSLRQTRRDGRKKLFTAEQCHAMLDHANPLMRACILLGLNCAFGAADCADLEVDQIDRDDMMVSLPRLKTLASRVCPLWPETLEAIDAAHAQRPKPKDPDDEAKVLLSPRGMALVAIGRAVRDKDGRLKSATHYDRPLEWLIALMEKAGIERQKGCGFATFRHTFYTVARATKDYDAVNVIMGHAGEGMVEHYLEDHDVDALVRVTDHVHGWLWPEKGGRMK